MNHDESKIQSGIVKELRHRGVLVFSVPNEFVKDARSMGVAITLGLLPGSPDLIACIPGKVLALEVKSLTGVQSPKQKAFKAKWECNGFEYHVVRSLDEVLKILDI